ncbi:MAG: ABC-2 transporter permease [Oscillospiraceae bacterium]|nr:ABC-2 transporter permease [Oscillospiraceae bacterium]
MKGLLRRYAYGSIKSLPFMLIFALIFSGAHFLMMYGLRIFHPLMMQAPSIIFGILPGSIMLQDSGEGWNRMALTFPITKRQQIGAVYIFALFTGGAAAVLELILSFPGMLLSQTGTLSELLAGLLLGLGASLWMTVILVPMICRLGGQEAGRLFIFPVLIPPALLMLTACFMDIGDPDAPFHIPFGLLTCLCIFLISAGLCVISWRISLRWHEQYETM